MARDARGLTMDEYTYDLLCTFTAYLHALRHAGVQHPKSVETALDAAATLQEAYDLKLPPYDSLKSIAK